MDVDGVDIAVANCQEGCGRKVQRVYILLVPHLRRSADMGHPVLLRVELGDEAEEQGLSYTTLTKM
jgi:hypothetical protein